MGGVVTEESGCGDVAGGAGGYRRVLFDAPDELLIEPNLRGVRDRCGGTAGLNGCGREFWVIAGALRGSSWANCLGETGVLSKDKFEK